MHAAYLARHPAAEVESSFRLYLRGAASPKVGGAASETAAVNPELRADPHAAVGAQAGQRDSAAAKERRLRALERMLQAAQQRVAKPEKPRAPAGSTRAPASSAPAAVTPAGVLVAQGTESRPGAETGDEPSTAESTLAQLQAVLTQLQQGQAVTMLAEMEQQGMREELGEDVWRQLSPDARPDGM